MPDKSEQSAGLYDYLNWRGDLSFESVPPCEVDNLIFSIISYIDLSGSVSEEFPKKRSAALLTVTRNFLRSQSGIIKDLGLIIPRETVTLLVRASKTERFGLTRPFCFVNRVCDVEQKQFCAVSFLLPGGDVFVAFRGTDDTLVGWKENFNMSFMHPVPAQEEAVRYLEYIAQNTQGRLYLGGHSKGGNLAVYSAVKACAAVQDRIAAVYSNDGPGFDREFIEGEDYKRMRDRIHTLLPQSSVVGMMLEHEESYTVVKSTTTGLLQHNGLTWSVMGGGFIKLDDIDEQSRLIDSSLKTWLESISREDRERFVDELYEALTATNAKTLSELSADKRKLAKAWSAIDNESRAQLMRCVNAIMGKKNTKLQRTASAPVPAPADNGEGSTDTEQ